MGSAKVRLPDLRKTRNNNDPGNKRRKRRGRSVPKNAQHGQDGAGAPSPYPFYDFSPVLENGSRLHKSTLKPTTHLKLRGPEETLKHVPQEPDRHFKLLKHATKLETYLISAPHPSVCRSLYEGGEPNRIERLSDSFYGKGVDYSESVHSPSRIETDESYDLAARSQRAMQQPIRENPSDFPRIQGNEDEDQFNAYDPSLGLLHGASSAGTSSLFPVNSSIHEKINSCSAGPSILATMDASVMNSRIQAEKIPQSIVPFHMLREIGAAGGSEILMPLPRMQSSAAYDASTVSRQDVVLLERWLSTTLRCVQDGSFSVQEKFEDIQRIYYMAFHELMRQSMVQCFERGQLLHQVWIEHILVFENRVSSLQHRIQELSTLVGMLQGELSTATAETTTLNSSLVDVRRTLTLANDVLEQTRQERDQERSENAARNSSTDDNDNGKRNSRIASSIFDSSTLKALQNQKAEGSTQLDRMKEISGQESSRSGHSDQFLRADLLAQDLVASQERVDELEDEVDALRALIPVDGQPRPKDATTQTSPNFDDIVQAEAQRLSMEELQKQTETQVSPTKGRWRRANSRISTVRMLTDSSMSINPEKWVIKQLNRILLERMSPNFEMVTQTMEQFVFDFYIRKYGLPSVAKKNIGVLAKNTFHYQTHPTVGIFVRISRGQMDEEATDLFLNALRLSTRPGNITDIELMSSSERRRDDGDNDDDDDDDDSDDEDAKKKKKKKKKAKKKKSKSKTMSSDALSAMAKRLKHAYADSTENNVIFPEDDDGNANWVSLDRCLEITSYLIPTIRKDDLEAMKEKLRAVTASGPVPTWHKIKPHILAMLERTPRVDRDVFLRLFTHHVVSQQRRQHDYFEGAFKAGDDNGDGVLELSEFQSIIQEIDPHMSLAIVTTMFTQAIQHPANNSGSEDAMSPYAFSIICRQHGLQKLLVENADGIYELKQKVK